MGKISLNTDKKGKNYLNEADNYVSLLFNFKFNFWARSGGMDSSKQRPMARSNPL